MLKTSETDDIIAVVKIFVVVFTCWIILVLCVTSTLHFLTAGMCLSLKKKMKKKEEKTSQFISADRLIWSILNYLSLIMMKVEGCLTLKSFLGWATIVQHSSKFCADGNKQNNPDLSVFLLFFTAVRKMPGITWVWSHLPVFKVMKFEQWFTFNFWNYIPA